MSDASGDAGQQSGEPAGQAPSGDAAQGQTDGGSTSSSGDGGSAAEAARTFSREDVNRMIAAESRKYADYADLKDKAGKFDELQAANQTDLEKAQSRAADEERKRIDTERVLNELRLERAVDRAATDKKVPVAAAVKMIDRAAVQFDSDGNPLNVDALLDALIEAEPWLIQGTEPGQAQAQRGSADQGNRGSTVNNSDMENWSIDQMRESLKAAR